MANPATLSWLQGITLAGVLAALGVLIRVSMSVGAMRNKVDTLWDWWLHDVTHVHPREFQDVVRDREVAPHKAP